MFMRSIAALVLVLSLASSAHAIDARREGAQLTTDFYAGRLDGVWARLSPQMKAALQSKDNFLAFRDQIDQQLGSESAVVQEMVNADQGFDIYRRLARFDKVSELIVVQWTFDGKGAVAGFFIRPDQAPPPSAALTDKLGYEARTRLRLPFDEEFYVVWGGRQVEENYHAINGNQRFAIDVLIVRDGSTHTSDGTQNEHYYCFGKPILAPADGNVVEVVEGVPDNVPGHLNPTQLTGNRVVLDHGNNEFSLLAHFKNGSIRVQRDAKVRSGDRLGDCGNSGNSTEPHLHYQLQDGAVFGEAKGLPAKFEHYLADDVLVTRGEPAKGQRIRRSEQ